MGVVCFNGIKSCYNLIWHTQATLAMQRMGVPKPAVCCLFSTLQQATHQDQTGCGCLEGAYNGVWCKIYHACVALIKRAVLSQLYRFWWAHSSLQLYKIYQLFLCRLLWLSSDPATWYTIQLGVDKWEGCLAVISGAIDPEKHSCTW